MFSWALMRYPDTMSTHLKQDYETLNGYIKMSPKKQNVHLPDKSSTRTNLCIQTQCPFEYCESRNPITTADDNAFENLGQKL